jgi:hypothetical protein
VWVFYVTAENLKMKMDTHTRRARQEELAGHIEDLVTEVKGEQEARERESLEHGLDNVEKTRESELRRECRALEDKDSALRSALYDISHAQSHLSQCRGNLKAIQNALRDMEQRSKEGRHIQSRGSRRS